MVAWHSLPYSALPVVKFHSLVYIETRDYSNCAASIILRTVAPKHHFEIRCPHNPCWEDLVVSAYNNFNLYVSFLGLTSRSESAADWTFEGRHSPDNCGHPRRTAHHRNVSNVHVDSTFHRSRHVGPPAILQRSEGHHSQWCHNVAQLWLWNRRDYNGTFNVFTFTMVVTI